MSRAKKKNKEEDKVNPLSEILSTGLFLLVVLVLTLLFIKYVGQRTMVSGSSMETMLSDGDNLIVDKLTYRFKDPERYDIIVFPFQYQKNVYFIKRIIGLPGESVRIDLEGNIYINGELLEEAYGREVIRDPGIAYNEIHLGSDEYFVLGDNRNNSSDSRVDSVGNIRRSAIIGRAWARIWPFSKIGMIEHR